MKRIIALVDYKKHFGYNSGEFPYRSGFDKKKLAEAFSKLELQVDFVEMSDAHLIENVKDTYVIYTSSEDIGYNYKSFIEDVVLSLQLRGAILVPDFKFLRANNNKVLMELIGKTHKNKWGVSNLDSWVFGTYEEMIARKTEFDFPIVVKTAEGAMSTGVSLARNMGELEKTIKSRSRTKYLKTDFKDFLRPFKHKGYEKESLYRRKFILQKYVPNLMNDWKILVFGEKYYVFSRPVRENDFRASGSGHAKYSYGSNCEFPEQIFDFAEFIYSSLEIPHLSLDIAYDGENFYIVEFQALYFGAVGFIKSDIYFSRKNGEWVSLPNNKPIETEYAEAVNYYIKKFNK